MFGAGDGDIDDEVSFKAAGSAGRGEDSSVPSPIVADDAEKEERGGALFSLRAMLSEGTGLRVFGASGLLESLAALVAVPGTALHSRVEKKSHSLIGSLAMLAKLDPDFKLVFSKFAEGFESLKGAGLKSVVLANGDRQVSRINPRQPAIAPAAPTAAGRPGQPAAASKKDGKKVCFHFKKHGSCKFGGDEGCRNGSHPAEFKVSGGLPAPMPKPVAALPAGVVVVDDAVVRECRMCKKNFTEDPGTPVTNLFSCQQNFLLGRF